MDRRTHPRKACLLKVYLRHERETWEGTILNYSDTGVFVASSRSVTVEDSVRLRFRRPNDASVIEVDGIIRRVVAEPGSLGGDTGYGIQLVEILSSANVSKGASGVFERPKLRETRSSISGTRDKARAKAAPMESVATETPKKGRRSRARDSRYVTYIKATYTPMTGGGAPLSGEIINISRHGLFLGTTRPPAEDSVVSVRIDGWDVDGSSDHLDLIAQVQWSKAVDDGGPRPPGAGMRIIGFGTPAAQKRFESLLRALLVVGNPIVGK